MYFVLFLVLSTVLQTNKATEIWKIYSELVNDQMNDFIPFSIRCFEIILTTHFLCHYNYCFYRCDPSLEALYISSTAAAEGTSPPLLPAHEPINPDKALMNISTSQINIRRKYENNRISRRDYDTSLELIGIIFNHSPRTLMVTEQ